MKICLEPSYISWSKNRTANAGGGVATAVARAYMDKTGGAGEGVGNDEYLITRVATFKPALNVVNCYGEQRKSTKLDVQEKWRRLQQDLENIRARNEFAILAGDLNKLVGNNELGVPGNHAEESLGGRLLKEMLASRNWFLVNGMGEEVVTGGPFTRLDPATGNKSCLDLFIVCKELKPYVRKLEIDSERKLGIARVEKIKKKGKFRLVYPDHFPVLLTLENLPLEKKEKEEKQVRWNLAKEGGWKHYKEESKKAVERLIDILNNKDYSIEETKKMFDKVHEHVKYKAFGKVTLRTNHKEKYEKRSKVSEEKQSEEDKAKKQWEEEVKRAEEEMKEIDKLKNGKVGKI